MKSSGSLFVRFSILGLLVLALLILGSKVLEIQSIVPIAAGIILSTLLMVGLYTLAVLRDDELLLEPDAPDLAYYLGFSLTVGALALTFLSDLMLAQMEGDVSQIAAAKGQLITRALSQFGAGLLATLFGLSAKIYLSSKQSNRVQDPTAVANKFRLELAEFRRLIEATSAELSSSIRDGCGTINNASSQAEKSIGSMAKHISDSSVVIAQCFNADKIGAPVAAFVKEVEGIAAPLASLREGVGKLNSKIDQVRSSLEKYDSVIITSAASIEAHTTKMLNAGNESDKLSQALVGLSKESHTLEGSIRSAAESIGSIASPAAGLVSTFEATLNAMAALSEASSDLTDELKTTKRAAASQSEQFTRLSGSSQTAEVSLNSLGTTAAEVSNSFSEGQKTVGNWTTELNSMHQAFSSSSDAVSTLGSVIRSSTDAHKSSEELLTTSARSLTAFNTLVSDASAELRRVVRALEQSQSAAHSFSVQLAPLTETTTRAAPTLAALSTSLEATRSAIAGLNSSADELSRRLKTMK